MKHLHKILLLTLLSLACAIVSCSGPKAQKTLDRVESIIEAHPDSALAILSAIDRHDLKGKKQHAQYALLMSMALDKNYIDTTTFDILQPAIDYYANHGSVDNKLRTMYYQGRIYQNRNDYNLAMQCFLKANDLMNYKDTLTFANMLVAQGKIYILSYQTESYVKNNLYASELYKKIGESRRELSCLLRALDGSICLNDKDNSDRIILRTDSLVQKFPELGETMAKIRMTYDIRFNSDSAINHNLCSISDFNQCNDETKLDITLGYLKLNEPRKAKMVFESINPNSFIANSFRYLSILPDVLEANKEYCNALEAYKKFKSAIDAENSKIYSQKTIVAQDLHDLKLNHLYSIQRKDRLIWLVLCAVLVLIIIIGVIYYQLRLVKIKRIVSEQEQARLQLENNILQTQNSVLELERNNTQLELEKKNLAAENMRLKISQLESESEHLKELLTEAKLSKPILDSIQERIGILNGLLAAKISANDSYLKPYDKWINQITEDRKSFMDSNRLAFRASHPAFMKYLDEHGLTVDEINYVCLYAIGLRGKEVGSYMKKRSHVHISSAIRKKLGIDRHETNIGIYVRKLLKIT